MKDISLRQASIVTGIALLLMAIVAPIALSIYPKMIVSGDGAETINNIIANERSFRLGIIGLLVVAILDVLVAWGLFRLLAQVNKSLSLLAAWFRVVYAGILVVALNHLLIVLALLNGDPFLQAFDSALLQAEVLVSYNAFHSGWNIGMVIFSLHLLVLGYLIIKSGFIYKVLGYLVVLAGAGYLFDGVARILVGDYSLNIGIYTFAGEVLLIFWLLIKGTKLKEVD
jgi:hypothetical protein